VGLGTHEQLRGQTRLVKDEDPDILFLSETKRKASAMERIRSRLEFSNKLYVDCRGKGRHLSKGLALFWKGHIEVERLGSDSNLIWRLTGTYGFPNDEDKPKTRNCIASLNNSNLPWLCSGDFNEILVQDDKQGGPPKSQTLIDSFQKVVLECNLKDIGFTGYPYTWSNNRGDRENVQMQLHRFLANEAWLTIFQWNRVRHLQR